MVEDDLRGKRAFNERLLLIEGSTEQKEISLKSLHYAITQRKNQATKLEFDTEELIFVWRFCPCKISQTPKSMFPFH